ncbi:DUF6677 family protein [Aestuariirhabdus sp. LZHN29]|uniref:DUF6677 family protein n=1 Tax=Aestuariirhabdus sp. LZHN29 TaxID=3417462 RepID=UPI003CF1D92F
MRKPIQAALLSALVFPGAGHLLLKRYTHGSLLVAVAMLSLYFLLSASIDMAQEIAVRIQRGDIALDGVSLREAVSSLSASNGQALDVPAMLYMVSWIMGVVSSYCAGREVENMSNNHL